MKPIIQRELDALQRQIDEVKSEGVGGVSEVFHDDTLTGKGTKSSRLSAAALSGTINSGIASLSGTVNSRFLNVTGSLVSGLANLSGTVNARVANLSGTIDGHFNQLSGTIDARFLNVTGSLISGLANLSGTINARFESTRGYSFLKSTALTSTTSGSTHDLDSATVAIFFRMVGGGGGGGAQYTGGVSSMGGGGAGGAYLEKWITGSVGSILRYQCGTAGRGQAGTWGVPGGDTTLVVNGITYLCKGGGEGFGQNWTVGEAAGGTVQAGSSAGAFQQAGFPGLAGDVNNSSPAMLMGGAGGNSPLGMGGGSLVATTSVGKNASGYGAGGGGILDNAATVALWGGSGSQGVIIVEEYMRGAGGGTGATPDLRHFSYVANGTEGTEVTVPLPTTRTDSNYSIFMTNGSTGSFVYNIPSGSKTTTSFKVVTSTALSSGEELDFLLVNHGTIDSSGLSGTLNAAFYSLWGSAQGDGVPKQHHLSASIDGHFNQLSGTVNARFIDLSGSVDSAIRNSGGGTYTTTNSDTFNRANSATNLGTTDGANSRDPATWVQYRGTWGITSNTAYVSAVSAGTQLNVAGFSVGTGRINCWAQGTITTLPTVNSTGFGLNIGLVDANNFYYAQCNRSSGGAFSYIIGKYIGGTATTLVIASGVTPAVNDVIKFERAEYGMLRLYVNGTAVTSAFDGTHLGGVSVGMLEITSGGTPSGARLDNFSAGYIS